MICPRCQQVNPDGSSSCCHCGASFAVPVRRHRPIVPGIVGLVLSSSGIFLAVFSLLFALMWCAFSSPALFDDPVGPAIIFIVYTIAFGMIGLGLNITGLILGKKARDRFDAEPNQHMGRGMYTAAYVLGVIGCVMCAAAIMMVIGISIFFA